MIRPAQLEDEAAVADVLVAAGMFSREDASAFLPALFADVLAEAGDGTTGLVVDVDESAASPPGDRVVGVAYWHPVEATDRVLDLTMIAVLPASQGRGRGRALMRHAEESARGAGQRLMLVQTSSTGQYDRTRAFYRGLGYTQVAAVADYWAHGDGMVMFRLDL